MRLMSRVHKRVHGKGQAGFSMMELVIVLALSLIIMAGMAGLIEMANNAFSSSRNLEAITDSARRTLGSINRQVKTALHINDALCNCNPTPPPTPQMSFWGDVDNDNPTADVDNWNGQTEQVRFFLSGTNLIQETIHPASDPTQPNATTTLSLGNNVAGVQFLFFPAGEKPVGDMINGYTNAMTSGYNAGAGMVKVIIKYDRRGMKRTFEQDMFLRILIRSQ